LFHEKRLQDSWRSRVKKLIDMGIVERTSRDKYILTRALYEVAGKSGVHTRLTGLDKETNKELIVKHISQCGEKGTPFKEIQQVLPSHTRSQLQILLRELRDEKRIKNEGKTKTTRWYLG